jgi:mTERF
VQQTCEPHALFVTSPSCLAPLSSTQLVTEVTDRLRIQSSSSKTKRRPRSKPPLVDSDLLRFLKTTQSQYSHNENEDRCYFINSIDNATSSMENNNISTTGMMTEIVSKRSEASIVPEDRTTSSSCDSKSVTITTTTSPVVEEFGAARSNSTIRGTWTTVSPPQPHRDLDEAGHVDNDRMRRWLQQFECTYIVSLLQKQSGANMEAAYAVGIVIERMSIARAAQKRLRSFIKERNQIWNVQDSRVSKDDSTSNMDSNCDNDNDQNMMDSLDNCDSNHNNMDQIMDVLLEYGLSTKDICEILMLSPSVAFMQARPSIVTTDHGNHTITSHHVANPVTKNDDQSSLQEILDRVFVGLLMGREPHELKLRKYDARKVLRTTPGLLTKRGSETAIQVIHLLVNLGVSSNSLSRDKNNLPILLSRQPNAVFRLVAFLSSDAVRMPIHKIGPLLRRTECQHVLNAIAPSRTMSRLQYSSSRQQQHQLSYTYNDCMGVGSISKTTSNTDITAQVQKAVVNDIYRRMSQTAWTLRNKIGTQDLGRVIAAYPSVLLLDATRQILPTAQYLMDELDILPDDLPSILQLYPALLRTDVEQMRNVVSYLMSLEVAEDNLGIIFRSFPVLLTLDIEHDMEPVVAFLQSIGVSNVGRVYIKITTRIRLFG